jgi:hypothetical protein
MDAGFRRHDEGLPLESLNLGLNHLGFVWLKNGANRIEFSQNILMFGTSPCKKS